MPFARIARAACLAAWLLSSACTRGPATLVPLRESTVGDLSASGTKEFQVSVQPGQVLLIEGEQLHFDFSVSLATPDGQKVLTVDSPGKRVATERLVYDAQQGGAYTVGVIGREHPRAKGKYRLNFYAIPRSQPAGLIDGYRAMSDAARKFSSGIAEQRVDVARIYEQAAMKFAAAKRPELEAEARHALAALSYQHLSDWAAAAENAHRAAQIFRAQGGQWRYAQSIGLEAAALTERGKKKGRGADAQPDLDRAAALLDEARTINLDHRDEFAVARNDNDRGLNLFYRDQFEAAVDFFHQAAARFGRLQERPSELMSLQDIATVQALRGNYRAAATKLERVLKELDRSADPGQYAEVAANSAFALAQIGETAEALRRYAQALEIQEAERDSGGQARSRQGVANIYWRLGERQRALEMFLATLPLREAAKDHRGIVVTLVSIGNLYRELGQLPQASAFHSRALDYATQNELPPTERMRVQIAMAGDRNAAGDHHGAMGIAEEARKLDVPRNHPFQARALLERARAFAGMGDLDAAATDLRQVITVQAGIGASFEESMARVMYADVLHRQQRHTDALAELDKALAQLESLRIQAAGPELRASFLSARHEAYGRRVQVLLEGKDPLPDAAIMEALLTAERSHARNLLDGLHARASSRRDVNPAAAQVAGLYEQLDGHQLRMQALLGQGIVATDGRMVELKAESSLLRARIEASAGGDLAPATAFDNVLTRTGLLELQRRLFPGDVVLNYFLSSPRSWVWMITRSEVRAVALPDQAIIGRSAARFLASLSHPSALDGELRDSGKVLAAQILGPVGLPATVTRAIVIPDGMLLHVPFNALPVPGAADGAKRMVDRVELTTAYSLSTLELLEERRREAVRNPRVLLIADPVFSVDDPRMPLEVRERLGANVDPAGLDMPRLPSTGAEAESIAKLLPADRVFLARGFDASKRAFNELQRGDYSILHFATHLRVDRDDPGLTSLLLSRMDAKGRSVRGSVAAYEIAAMQLHAELVVLSACDSSTGKDFRGEGMLGLGRAFLLSGAQSVIATQWQVADRATSELMRHLYIAMLQQGKSPAAALRSAQLTMKNDERWQHPYYWAGFVVYGSPGLAATSVNGVNGVTAGRHEISRWDEDRLAAPSAD